MFPLRAVGHSPIDRHTCGHQPTGRHRVHAYDHGCILLHIHLFDEEAVSWDTVTLGEENDVTDNELLDEDVLRGARLATEDGHFLIHDLLAESQELFLFAPVTESLDGSSEEDGEEDGYTLEPLALLVLEEAEDEGDTSEDDEDPDVELVKLVPQYSEEAADLWEGSLVYAEEFLSSQDIFDVTDDAGLGIGGQAFEESSFPLHFLEDDQTLPSLALVVRHSLVLAEEEESVQKAVNRLKYEFKRTSEVATYSSSSGRNLKTEETESSGVLWYYAMRGYFS